MKTEQRKILDGWFERISAACLWANAIPNVGHVKAYQANGRVFLVVVYKDAGFDIYTGNDKIELSAAFTDAERRLGLIP